MIRRKFIKKATLGIALSGMGEYLHASFNNDNISNSGKFKLKYAPSLDMFKEHAGNDPIDNIRFIADQGFKAVFDNKLMQKEPALQEKIANELAKRSMDLGPFVIFADFKEKSLVTQDPQIKEMLKKLMNKGVEVANRTNAKTALIVPGLYDQGEDLYCQTANVIENMRICCDITGAVGLELCMEPINAWNSHLGMFLTKISQGIMICKAVNNPYCKIVNDIYHQQIMEGNIIRNIDKSWEYIAAFHVADNPGRKEPLTGEINFKNIFRHIYLKGYDGVICMEHGNSINGKEGELAVISVYREVDSFEV